MRVKWEGMLSGEGSLEVIMTCRRVRTKEPLYELFPMLSLGTKHHDAKGACPRLISGAGQS